MLLLAGPDATGLRIEAEAAVRRLSGVLAMTPADADVVLETGELSGSLRAAADVLWAQVPEPRSRLVVTTAGAVEAELRAELRRFPGAGHADGTAAGDRSLPMADRGEDRDGLMLDVLHLPLGPFLPHWPAGLVVDVELQGDVVQQARARDLTIGTPGNEP
ncbi:MAG TPA: hypothetical protein VFH77_11710, partial [Streptomyces sp.]|nr:hypothetical protein [Streptomyces sp.]